MMSALLEVRAVSKAFPGVRALEGVSFDLRPGEVHALMGENGAGKSTLVKILSGIHQPDSGAVHLDGREVRIADPTHSQSYGISTVHQELHLESYLSVAENIFLGRQPLNRFGLIDYRRMQREATALLAEFGSSISADSVVGELSIAQRQIVAVARAISTNCKIVIYDEPTSSFTENETARLFDAIRSLRKRGIGVIYISHRLEEIFRLCDRVTVLRDGRLIATKDVQDTNIRDLIGMMIGRELSDLFKKKDVPIGAPVLDVRNVSVAGLLENVSLQVHRGEIVGMAGLMGAGRTELARAIFGDLRRDSGEIRVDGELLPVRNSPRAAIRAGIGLVPEDRKEQGLVTQMSVGQNISMAVLPSLARANVVSARRERGLGAEYVERLAIKTPSIDQKVLYLSGGNQQRVVIAKWLAADPKVLVIDEPTRGVDVGAMAEIHSLLCDLAARGVGILMISSDMNEILAMSDRVLVMHQGRISGELIRQEATQEAIMHLATGQAGRAPGHADQPQRQLVQNGALRVS